MRRLIPWVLLIAGVLVAAWLVMNPVRPAAQTPQNEPLLQQADLVYLGSFKLPAGTYGFQAPTLSVSAPGKLLVDDREITVPTLVSSTTLGGLATATFTGFQLPLVGGVAPDWANRTATINLVDPNANNGKRLAGTLKSGSNWIFSSINGYGGTATTSHYRYNGSSITGPALVSGTPTARYVAGWMTAIPSTWQALMGGDALTGNCCLSIIGTMSLGPSATVFTAASFTGSGTATGTWVLGYPIDHATLGGCDQTSLTRLFDCTTQMGGMVWPSGTRSVLYFGRLGLGYAPPLVPMACYGNGTTNPALHGTIGSDGAMWCYDPVPSGKGPHAYPYVNHIWAYDANDLLAAKAGTKQPWEVTPYGAWRITNLPFQDPEGYRQFTGAAYDPSSNRIYVGDFKTNGDAPLIRVYSVSGGSAPTPPPPPPTPTPTLSASPNPCAIASGATNCTSTITWDAQGATTGAVFVDGTLFACGLTGSSPAPWIVAGQTFVFNLYGLSTCNAQSTPSGPVLATASVTATPPPAPPPAPEPPPAPAPGPATGPLPDGYTFCANENSRCSFTGTTQVVYGAGSTFTLPASFTDGVDCTNGVFGDPLQGTFKGCYRAPLPAPPPPTPPPTPEPGPTPAGPTATISAATCVLGNIRVNPPDATGGWRATFYLDGVSIGTDNTTPFTRPTTNVRSGSHGLYVVFTKTGQANRTSSTTTYVCS